MKKYSLTILISCLFFFSSFAQEGMWLLDQIGDLDLNKKGLEIDVSEIYNPDQPALYNAIVQLGGGTSSFVSAQGLMLTNHHVAYTALQRASTTETDYIANGFVAREYADEIQAPGYQARLLQEMKDVTDEVLSAGKGIDDATERDKKINQKIAAMTDKLEKKSEDIDAVVAAMYNGKQYFLFVYKVFKDIRIVYAPPVSIGEYGGDIDNWMWPRHTGDFSFMRVYVSPEGNGAEYNESNVPYKPKVWLKVAKDNLKPGDFTFIIGYPGYTTRYRTSNSAAWNLKYNYPYTIKNFGAIIDLMEKITKDDHEGQLKVAGLKKGLANTMKNYQGKVDGMKKTKFVQKKREFEAVFMNWVNSTPETKAKYENILTDITAQYDIILKTKDRDNVMGTLRGLSCAQLGVAGQVYLNVKEREKPKKEQRPGFSEKTIERAIENMEYAYMRYYEPVDKAMFERSLNKVNKLPQGQRIEPLEYIFTSKSMSIHDFVNDAFETSRLDDPEYVISLYELSSKELEALNDPFINMIAALYPMMEESNLIYEEFAANVTDLRKQYIDALYEWKGSGLYPDANGTIRFTSGPVKGYSPANAVWYRPFTSLAGVLEKDTGEEPFDAPEKLIKLYENKDFGSYMDPELKDVPIAFLHQCDITGGNSGSPVLNAKGELIGCAFDGNYEAMISDWQYDAVLQRTISVDIRYVMFVTEKFGNASFVLEEMGAIR